jgi:spore coat protein CotH
MGKKRLYQTSALLLAVFLVAPLCIGLTGCDAQDEALAQDDPAPFYSDRVVTVRFVMSEDDWEYMQDNALEEQYARADMWYDDKLVEDIALRPKGNSSLNTTVKNGSIRFSLKADLNFFNSARNLDGVKKLNFNNGFSDPTFMRETLAYDIFREMDVPAPRTSFVDLWINDTHMGLYTMVEQVDTTFLSNHFTDSTGNLYKPEMPAAALGWTEADYEKQMERQGAGEDSFEDELQNINLGGGLLSEIISALEPGNETEEDEISPDIPRLPDGIQIPEGARFREGRVLPENARVQQRLAQARGIMGGGQGDFTEQMGLKTNENKPDYSGLFRFLEVLNNEPEETFRQEIEKVLDVDGVLRFLAVSTALVHLDNYTGNFGHNYYLYEDDGKFTVIPWDLNMAFGTFNLGLGQAGIINFLIDEPTGMPVAERPLVSRLLAVPEYLETYHEYLYELIDGPFSPAVIKVKIKEIADMIRPYVEADPLKFYPTQAFEASLTSGVQPRRAVAGMQLSIGLLSFVHQRVESIREQLEGNRPSTNNGQGNGGSMTMPDIRNQDINYP